MLGAARSVAIKLISNKIEKVCLLIHPFISLEWQTQIAGLYFMFHLRYPILLYFIMPYTMFEIQLRFNSSNYYLSFRRSCIKVREAMLNRLLVIAIFSNHSQEHQISRITMLLLKTQFFNSLFLHKTIELYLVGKKRCFDGKAKRTNESLQ